MEPEFSMPPIDLVEDLGVIRPGDNDTGLSVNFHRRGPKGGGDPEFRRVPVRKVKRCFSLFRRHSIYKCEGNPDKASRNFLEDEGFFVIPRRIAGPKIQTDGISSEPLTHKFIDAFLPGTPFSPSLDEFREMLWKISGDLPRKGTHLGAGERIAFDSEFFV